MSSSASPQYRLAQCICCRDNFSEENVWEAHCGCPYCTKCLEGVVSARLEDKGFRFPICCGQLLPWSEVSDKINDELATAFEEKMEEFKNTIPVYCSDRVCPGSSALIKAQHISTVNHTATCPICQRAVCTKCKKDSHPGDCTPDAELKEVLELAEQEEWQRCQRCGEMIEHIAGCEHMT